MNTPVTHGSGTMLVTAVGADAQVGKIAGMLATTAKEQTPLTKQLNTLTLWIGAAALGTMIVMFALGLSRGQSADALFITAIALAIAAIPTALPTVLQVILSAGREGARRRERDRQGPRLGGDARVDVGDQLRQDRHADDEPDDGRRSARPGGPLHDLRDRLRPGGQGPPRGRRIRLHRRCRSCPYIIASDAKLVDGKVVGDPPRVPCWCSAPRRAGHRGEPGEVPATGHAAVRPDLQTDGDLQLGHRLLRREGGALLRERRGSRRDGPRRDRARRRRERAVGRQAEQAGRRCPHPHGRRGAQGDGRSLPRSGPRHVRCRRRFARLRHRSGVDVPRRHGRPAPRRIQGGRVERPERPHQSADGHR